MSSVYQYSILLSMQAHNSMFITIHNLPSRREAFCSTRPWINHTFIPSILSSIMHSLLSVSKYDYPCDWLTEWTDETMAALFFTTPRHWHSYLPWRHFHLPAPPPPLLPFLCSYPIQRLLFISLQSSQSSQDSQPANQRGTKRMYCSLFTGVWWETWDTANHSPFLSLMAHWYSLFFFTARHSLTSSYPKLPPLTTPNQVAGRSTTLRNKQTLQQHTHTDLELGQLGF